MAAEATPRPQSAEAAELEMQLQRKRQRLRDILLSPRRLVLLVGIVPLLLITLPPIWGAIRLLEDPVYVFLHGVWLPELTVKLCVGSVLGYVLVVFLFFRCGARENKDNRAMMAGQIVFTLVCITLGMSLLLLSIPLRQEVAVSYEDLFTNCQAGPRTRALYEYAASLQVLRRTPACVDEASVERCPGYVASQPYANFLKELESRFQCSGFCHVAENVSTPLSTTSPAPKSAKEEFMPQSVVSSGKWPPLAQSEANLSATMPVKGVPGAGVDYRAASVGVRVLENRARIRGGGRRPNHRSPGNMWTEMRDEISRDIHGPPQPEHVSTDEKAGSEEAATAATETMDPDAEAGGDVASSLLAVSSSSFSSHAHPPSALAPINPGGLLGENPFTRLGPPFPPPLFSSASDATRLKTHKVSCEGMAAWSLGFKALDVARLFYWEGLLLLLAMFFGGLYKLSSMCCTHRSLFESCGCHPAGKQRWQQPQPLREHPDVIET